MLSVLPRSLTISAVVLGVALLATGCDIGDFGDTNEDPTRATEVDAQLLVTRSLAYGTLRYDAYQRSQHLLGNLYSQHFANFAPSFPTGRYESSAPYDDWVTSFWNATYAAYGGGENVGENVSNAGVNIQIAIDQTEDDPEMVNINAQARIWKVYLLHRITDAWGDVPYSEAFAGLEGNTSPSYDPQEDIYRDMLNTLESAAQNLDSSIQGDRFRLGDADLLFDDDLSKWRRFANALRLRLAMRVAEAAPDLAEQHVQAVTQEGELMQSNDDSARRPTTSGGDFITQNPLSVISTFEDDRVSETVVDTLKALDDPRLPVYADTIGAAFQDSVAFRGLPNGLDSGTLSELQGFRYSAAGETVTAPDFPVPVLLYPEVKFLEAEAALRGWGSGSAEAHYEEGIQASLAMYDITDSQVVDDYLAQPGVEWDASGSDAEKLEQIITQKWIALFSQGLEMWAEFRRTGYPDLRPIPGEGETGGAVPSRLLYPDIEQTTNTENVNAASDRIGGDQMTTDVWWDQERSSLVRSDGSEDN
ncbi:MAG: SusD/RagB family nutrient-binding outer membrane lipoprotein [Salinivenus sp.]